MDQACERGRHYGYGELAHLNCSPRLVMDEEMGQQGSSVQACGQGRPRRMTHAESGSVAEVSGSDR